MSTYQPTHPPSQPFRRVSLATRTMKTVDKYDFLFKIVLIGDAEVGKTSLL